MAAPRCQGLQLLLSHGPAILQHVANLPKWRTWLEAVWPARREGPPFLSEGTAWVLHRHFSSCTVGQNWFQGPTWLRGRLGNVVCFDWPR